MPVFLAVVIVITWTVAGFVLVLVGGTEIMPLFGVRHMEGYSAMMAFVYLSPFGAIGGFAAGICAARSWRANVRKLALAAGIPVAAFAAIAVAALIDDIRSRPPERHTYAMFTVEFRLPAGVPAPARDDMLIELRHEKPDQTMTASLYPGDWDRRRSDGRVVLQGLIDTWSRSTNRTIAYRVGAGPTYLFKIEQPPEPSDAKFTDWQPADTVQPAGVAQPGRNIEFRYSVNKKY